MTKIRRGSMRLIPARDEEVRERWRNRGVTAIPYRNTDRQHSALWNTLEAWAERTDDPKAWRLSLVEMARRGPRALAPHERGQVVALTSTVAGAKFFTDADPALPAEWLCVFDKTIRRAEPSSSPMTEDKFDPLEFFGLDDDPPRSSIEEDSERSSLARRSIHAARRRANRWQ